MKLNFIKLLSLFFILSLSLPIAAQKSNSKTQNEKAYPATFTISKSDFDNLFSKKQKEVVETKTNKYLNKSAVLMNTLNGDTKFLKVKLNYFKNAYLMVQVNGEYSTQIFVLSDDKSVFYKGELEKGNVLMTKCNEDDIVSE